MLHVELENIITEGDLAARANEFVALVSQKKELVVVTEGNRPVAALIAVDQLEELTGRTVTPVMPAAVNLATTTYVAPVTPPPPAPVVPPQAPPPVPPQPVAPAPVYSPTPVVPPQPAPVPQPLPDLPDLPTDDLDLPSLPESTPFQVPTFPPTEPAPLTPIATTAAVTPPPVAAPAPVLPEGAAAPSIPPPPQLPLPPEDLSNSSPLG